MGLYTVSTDPDVDARIHEDVVLMTKAVREEFGEFGLIGLVLLGGFGRGEGTVVREKGTPRPVNDYDLYAVSDTRPPVADVEETARKLADRLGIDFVDLAFVTKEYLAGMSPTIFSYELKYGSRVILGSKEILDVIPEMTPDGIPTREAWELLSNRIGDLLGRFPLRERAKRLDPKRRTFVSISVSKALLACGDALLLLCGRYHYSYVRRRQEFNEILAESRIRELLGDAAKRVDQAYEQKLEPRSIAFDDPVGVMHRILPAVEATYLYIMESMSGVPRRPVARAIRNDLRLTIGPRLPLRVRYGRLKSSQTVAGFASRLRYPRLDARRATYYCLALVLFSHPYYRMDQRALDTAERLLVEFAGVTKTRGDYDERWDAARSAAFKTWKGFFHTSDVNG